MTWQSNQYQNRWGELEEFYQPNLENKMSKFGTLNWGDFIRGLIVAVLSAVLTFLVQVLNGAVFDLRVLGLVSAIAFCAYIVKNLGTTADGKFLGVL